MYVQIGTTIIESDESAILSESYAFFYEKLECHEGLCKNGKK